MSKTTKIFNEDILKNKGERGYTITIYRDIRNSMAVGDEIWFKDEEFKEGTTAIVTYLGSRFATVKTPKGHHVSINYTSIIDKNSKEVYSTNLIINPIEE